MNFSKCYEGGRFSEAKLFVDEYGVLPNKLIFNLDKETFDLEAITLNFLKEHFPDAIFSKIETAGEIKNEDFNTIDLESEINPFNENNVLILKEKCFILIRVDGLIIWYDDQDVKNILENILPILPRKKQEFKSSEVNLVAFDQGYYTITSNINPVELNIEENYNDDFLPIYKDIEDFLSNRESGLVILRGIIGSGKTSFIRHLITTHIHNYIIITNSLAEHISSPEFISFMLDNKDSVFILEDCEQILMDRKSNFNSAISNILNMSDGLLSDIFNIKFICTFNADINTIDPALLRKGRCFANYEFKPLCLKKTNALQKKLKHPESTVPMTLAEIYNYNNTDCTTKTQKIGF